MDIGTHFSKNEGSLDLALEGGHSKPRIVHAKDLTGKEIESALVTRVNSLKNIRVIENTIAIDLITEHNIKQLKSSTSSKQNVLGCICS